MLLSPPSAGITDYSAFFAGTDNNLYARNLAERISPSEVLNYQTLSIEQHTYYVLPPVNNTPIPPNNTLRNLASFETDDSDLDDLCLDSFLAEDISADAPFLTQGRPFTVPVPATNTQPSAKRPRAAPAAAAASEQPVPASKRPRRGAASASTELPAISAAVASEPAAAGATPEPARRKPKASWNGARCSPAVFTPGAQYGVCGFCDKLLMFSEPPHETGERLTWFGRHRGSGKRTTADCRGCDPAVFEQWRREDWEGAPRTLATRPAPPPLSAINFLP